MRFISHFTLYVHSFDATRSQCLASVPLNADFVYPLCAPRISPDRQATTGEAIRKIAGCGSGSRERDSGSDSRGGSAVGRGGVTKEFPPNWGSELVPTDELL